MEPNIICMNIKDNVSIQYVNSIINDETHNKYNIYKYVFDSNCVKYFKISDKYKYIAYVNNTNFYLINLINTTNNNNTNDNGNGKNNEKMCSKLTFINNNVITILSSNNRVINNNVIKNLTSNNSVIRNITSGLSKLNIAYLILKKKCTEVISLDSANSLIKKINTKLKCTKYNINLSYVFQMPSDTKLNAYSFDGETLLLCLFNDNTCVSSLTITYNDGENTINIDSKTHPKYERNKFNILLRSVVIIIAKYLFPESKYIASVPINPASAYIMVWYFGGNIRTTISNSEPKIEKYDMTNKTQTHLKQYVTTKIYSTDDIDIIIDITNAENIDRANTVFNTTVDAIKLKYNCVTSAQIGTGYPFTKTHYKTQYKNKINYSKNKTKKQTKTTYK